MRAVRSPGGRCLFVKLCRYALQVAADVDTICDRARNFHTHGKRSELLPAWPLFAFGLRGTLLREEKPARAAGDAATSVLPMSHLRLLPSLASDGSKRYRPIRQYRLLPPSLLVCCGRDNRRSGMWRSGSTMEVSLCCQPARPKHENRSKPFPAGISLSKSARMGSIHEGAPKSPDCALVASPDCKSERKSR